MIGKKRAKFKLPILTDSTRLKFFLSFLEIFKALVYYNYFDEVRHIADTCVVRAANKANGSYSARY